MPVACVHASLKYESCSGAGCALTQAPAQPALDKGLELAIEDGLDVANLDSSPYVFDQRVRLHDIVADLASELGWHDVAPQRFSPAGGLLLLVLEQPRPQHLHRAVTVLDLRALVLTLHDDPGRKVCDTHSRVCLVHMLTACAGRSVCVDAEVVRVDLYLRLL